MQLTLSSVMLQAAQPGGGMMPIFLMVGMFVVMYFFMIRPQAKKAKEQKAFADSMNAGEQIVTTAGIHARINRANEDGTLQVEISRGTFMTIERSAVSMELTAAFRKKADAAAGIATTATK
ncbi:MAG: preprotein translocase, YajC subunit [Flavipsychrobacter sp.]|nr:preprotein translocase, YajC subunit [Flavipsychrobacter sp.]